MSGLHLTRELYQALERGEKTGGELTSLLLNHLFTLCPHCQEVFEAVNEELVLAGAGMSPVSEVSEGGAEEEGPEGSLESAELAELCELALAADIATMQELLDLPSGKRLEAVQKEPEKFRSLMLAYLLLEGSRERLPGKPGEAHELARLAAAVAHQTDEQGALELYALALAYQGNARRVQGDLQAAHDQICEARYLLRTRGGGPPLLIAELDSLEGSLRRAERRLGEAQELLARAALTYRLEGAGYETQRVRVLLKLGSVHKETGDLPPAFEATRQALELAERAEASRLVLYACHNLATLYQEVGDYEEARRIVEENRPLYQRYTDPLTQLRLLSLEGHIAWGLGDRETAAETYRAAREGFLRHELAYDAALISLNLASLYLEQGRTREVKELAGEMLPVFRSREIHREAGAALLLFVEAARAEQLTATFLRELTRYLEAARNNRELVFQPAA